MSDRETPNMEDLARLTIAQRHELYNTGVATKPEGPIAKYRREQLEAAKEREETRQKRFTAWRDRNVLKGSK